MRAGSAWPGSCVARPCGTSRYSATDRRRADGLRIRRFVLVVSVAAVLTPSSRHELVRAAGATTVAPDSEISNPAPDGLVVPPPCPLCAADHLDVPLRTLSVDEVSRIGAEYSTYNMERIASIDSLLRAGAFGPRKSSKARRQ